MTNDAEIPIKVAASFQQLKLAANQLNTVSDELGKSIAALDGALKRLNLGISAWVTFRGSPEPDPYGNYWAEQLGYDKVGPKWGIAVRTMQGNAQDGYEDPDSDEWLFNDAPRALRIKAADHLPSLLEELTKEASATAAKLKDKIGQVQKVVDVIDPRPAGQRK